LGVVLSVVVCPLPEVFLIIVDQIIYGEADELVLDAKVRAISATLFDDFGGLMAPLLNDIICHVKIA
jgi:hypothetical protein